MYLTPPAESKLLRLLIDDNDSDNDDVDVASMYTVMMCGVHHGPAISQGDCRRVTVRSELVPHAAILSDRAFSVSPHARLPSPKAQQNPHIPSPIG